MAQLSPSQKQLRKEKILNRLQLVGWKKENSLAYLYLKRRFPKLTKPFLIKLARCLACQQNIEFDRNSLRNKTICIKWFDDHFSQLYNYLETNLCVVDENNEIVGLPTEASQKILEIFQNQNQDSKKNLNNVSEKNLNNDSEKNLNEE